MNIEIQQPEIKALLQQRRATGAFEDVEAVLVHALKSPPVVPSTNGRSLNEVPRSRACSGQTGADPYASMQEMPRSEEEEKGKLRRLSPELTSAWFQTCRRKK